MKDACEIYAEEKNENNSQEVPMRIDGVFPTPEHNVGKNEVATTKMNYDSNDLCEFMVLNIHGPHYIRSFY